MNKQKGFTLIELLVVVAIIGILSAVVIASVTAARTKAEIAKTKAQLKNFEKMVIQAQGETNKILGGASGITGNAAFNSAGDASCGDTPPGAGCIADWTSAKSAVFAASQLYIDNGGLDADSWGSAFLLDENEGDTLLDPCEPDIIFSVGPNKTRDTADPIGHPASEYEISFSGDDFGIALPRKNDYSCDPVVMVP